MTLAAAILAVRLVCPDGRQVDLPVPANACEPIATPTTLATTTSRPPTTATTTTLPPTAGLALSPPFLGLVHETVCDTSLAQPGLQQNWWSAQCSGACSIGGAPYSCNQWEVPLMWEDPSWDTAPATITSTMQAFFQQNPKLAIWQFGWEGNIKGKCCSASQLTTIDQQLAAVRQAQRNVGNAAKLAYQLVWQTGNAYNGTGTSLGGASSIQAFLAPTSPAPKNLDYIALHPYLWNNWPNPDTWVGPMLSQLKGWIAASQNPRVKIIFTEGGATVCDASTTGCTCIENGTTTVRAMPQWEHADYWIKSHVLALANGVEKVVWYSGQTDGTCTTGSSCEATCFGITNGAGRQTKTAYATMTKCLGQATAVRKLPVLAPLQAYDFTVPAGHCIVAWTYQPGTTEVVRPTLPQVPVSVATLASGRAGSSVTDKLGVALSSSTLTLSPSPVFIRTP